MQSEQHASFCLASGSPRRQKLLAGLGLCFTTVLPDVDESARESEGAQAYVSRLALLKARAGMQLSDGTLPVLGADTTVVVDGHILGKPEHRQHADSMLQQLSGRWHEVLSAVAVVKGSREKSALSVTRVLFRNISESERLAYWESGEPLDKAGGYAIQGRAALFVERLEGSYSGVVGLPLFETAGLLAEFGIRPERMLGSKQQ